MILVRGGADFFKVLIVRTQRQQGKLGLILQKFVNRIAQRSKEVSTKCQRNQFDEVGAWGSIRRKIHWNWDYIIPSIKWEELEDH